MVLFILEMSDAVKVASEFSFEARACSKDYIH